MKLSVVSCQLSVAILLSILARNNASAAPLPAVTGFTNVTAGCAYVLYTNDVACTGTLYYGQSDGGTNATNWANSAAVGVLAAGKHSTQITNLTAARIYYARFFAQTNTSAWSSPTNFWTLAAAPANLPAGGFRAMLVDSNGVLQVPTMAQFIAGNPALASTNGAALAALAYDISTQAIAYASNTFLAVTNAGPIAFTATNYTATLTMDCASFKSLDVTNAMTGGMTLTMSNMVAGTPYTVTVRTDASPRLFTLAFGPTNTTYIATGCFTSTTIPAGSTMIVQAQKMVNGHYIFSTMGAQ